MNSLQMVQQEYFVGPLFRGLMRKMLEKARFDIGNFEWHERKEFLRSVFTVRCSDSTLRKIDIWVDSLNKA